MDSVVEIYNKLAPRWFKVIRWREFGHRFFENQKFSTWLFFKRPKTQEEFDAIKRKAFFEHIGVLPLNIERDYKMGQYKQDMPPLYDLAVRRQAYPQYYAGRYDGFVRHGV